MVSGSFATASPGKLVYSSIFDRINNLFEKLKSKLFFNGILRSLLETYLKLCISTMTGLQHLDSPGNSALTILLFVAIPIGFPIFTFLLLRRRVETLPDDTKRIGSLYLNLAVESNPRAWLMTPLFLLRRLAFAGSVVYGPNAVFQAYVQVALSLSLVYFLVSVSPYDDPLLNGMEIFNEVTLLALAYFMFLFSDFVPDAEVRYTLGWVFSGTIAFNLGVNWTVLMSRMLKQIARWIRLKYRNFKRAKKEALEVEDKGPK